MTHHANGPDRPEDSRCITCGHNWAVHYLVSTACMAEIQRVGHVKVCICMEFVPEDWRSMLEDLSRESA